MTTKRAPKESSLTPTYEEENPAANKLTIAPHTEHERTILLHIPRGRANRKKTAELLPFLAAMDAYSEKSLTMSDMSEIIGQMWADDKFEEDIVPFVLGFESQRDINYLEDLSLMELFEAFMTAAGYIITGGEREDFQEALKKSRGEAEEPKEDS